MHCSSWICFTLARHESCCLTFLMLLVTTLGGLVLLAVLCCCGVQSCFMSLIYCSRGRAVACWLQAGSPSMAMLLVGMVGRPCTCIPLQDDAVFVASGMRVSIGWPALPAARHSQGACREVSLPLWVCSQVRFSGRPADFSAHPNNL